MNTEQAERMLQQTFECAFNKEQFKRFIRELLNKFDEKNIQKESFNQIEKEYFQSLEQIGEFKDTEKNEIDILIVTLKEDKSLERTRTAQRNLIINRLKNSWKEAALVAFVSHNLKDWRLSLVKLEYTKKGEVKKDISSAIRWSFLLGENKKSRTAKDRFSEWISKTEKSPTLQDLEKAFAVEPLNKEFYEKLLRWYEKAQKQVIFPNDEKTTKTEEHKKTSLIRLLTRLLFVWFLKEKKLVQADLFNKKKLEKIIKWKESSSFYKAILQNLFFVTLNQEIENREFRNKENYQGINKDYGNQYYYRYHSLVLAEADWKNLFSKTPFLNGGLFQCLDRKLSKDNPDKKKLIDERNKDTRKEKIMLRIDGFSDKTDNVLQFPNDLFFNEDETGLIDLFNRYQFTVEESTPLDIDVALEPELLGKVLENLLASYNPETSEQTRKTTGSFYTPREIVSYMVDESLKQYFSQKTELKDLQINDLFNEKESDFSDNQKKEIIRSIDTLKIIDPAVGSGAFTMGILQRLISILNKIDPKNIYYKKQQTEKAEKMSDDQSKRASLEIINQVFSQEKQYNAYGKKLFLIENCIYGVDIQPIAIQICKLRFFISLAIEQEATEDKENNYGIRSLPNLETKFIVANSLLGLTDKTQPSQIAGHELVELKAKLKTVRLNYFTAKTQAKKSKLRQKDKKIRKEMGKFLKNGLSNDAIEKIANWDLYNQNTVADWFEPEWQFGVADGFDIVLGNPPYGFRNVLTPKEKKYFRTVEKIEFSSGDSAELFCKKCFDKLLKNNGILTFIIPKKSLYGDAWTGYRKDYWNKYNLKYLIDTSKSFENVLLEMNIFGLEKTYKKGLVKCGYLNKNNTINIFSISDKSEIFMQNNTAQIYKLSITKSFWDKIQKSKSNESLVLGKLGLAIGTDFFSDKQTKYKLLKGIDISQWKIKKNRWLKNTSKLNWNNAKKFLVPKVISQVLIAHIENPIPHIKITACYDDEGIIITNTLMSFDLDKRLSPLFWLAFLNSSFVSWYAYNFIYARAVRTMHFYNFYIQQIPIPKSIITHPKEQEPFIALVDKILQQKTKDNTANTTELQKQIDCLVYKLYNLTAEEIRIIEKN